MTVSPDEFMDGHRACAGDVERQVDRLIAYVEKAVADETETLRTVPDDGAGNDTLNKATYRLARLGAAVSQLAGAGVDLLSRERVREVMRNAISGWTFRTSPEQDQWDTIDGAIDAGWASPRSLDEILIKVTSRDIPHQRQESPDVSMDGRSPGDAGKADGAEERGAAALTLPEEFWSSRKMLAHIRTAAHARMCSADAVLFALLARVSGMVPPQTRADADLGSASLNLYAALVGPPGAGKSVAHRTAQALLPAPVRLDDWPDGAPLGSGEGLAELYMATAKRPTGETNKDGSQKMAVQHVQVRHNASVYADEGEVLGRMLERSGATVGETLRRGWVGETLGQSNGSRDTTRIVKRDSYSLGMVIGFQPETAVPLLKDAPAGTPQRFLWSWAADPSIPEKPVDWPGALAIGRAGVLDRQVTVTFPDSVRAELRAERLGRNRGTAKTHPLDTHGGLSRVKVAALLALMDGRSAASEADWELAGMVWATSCKVRDHLLALGRRQAREERKQQMHHRADAEVYIEGRKNEAAVQRVAGVIYRALYRAEGRRLSRSAARRSLQAKDRRQWDEALEYAVKLGWLIAVDDKHLGVGSVMPP